MSGSLTRKYFMVWYTLLIVVAGWIIGLSIALFFPEHTFDWYPFIPVFFYILGWFTLEMFEACRQYAPQKMQWVYLGTKTIKLVISLIVLFMYAITIEEKKTEFAITFLMFYFISLIFESKFFFRYERNEKLKIKK